MIAASPVSQSDARRCGGACGGLTAAAGAAAGGGAGGPSGPAAAPSCDRGRSASSIENVACGLAGRAPPPCFFPCGFPAASASAGPDARWLGAVPLRCSGAAAPVAPSGSPIRGSHPAGLSCCSGSPCVAPSGSPGGGGGACAAPSGSPDGSCAGFALGCAAAGSSFLAQGPVTPRGSPGSADASAPRFTSMRSSGRQGRKRSSRHRYVPRETETPKCRLSRHGGR